MHLVATFGPNQKDSGFHLAFLLEDCKTSFGRRLSVASEDQLVSVVRKLQGDPDALQMKLLMWGQGSIHVKPSPAQMEWLATT